MTRKIDELGRIVVPMEMRRKLKIREGDELEVTMDKEKGVITIKKERATCLRCRSAKNLTDIVRGYSLCEECLQELYGQLSAVRG